MVFSAEWCLNCKALEQSVLTSAPVVERFSREDVAPIKVDITGNNPQGKAKLQEIGHLTIPLLVVYSPEGKEVFRSDFYTVDQILAVVNRARSETGAAAPGGD
jgi:thiol:disulfide interchange protein DsbD